MKGTVLRMSVGIAVTFLGGAFILPGAYSAIMGGPVPAPSLMDSWGSWITMWAVISVVAHAVTEFILRQLTRRRRPH